MSERIFELSRIIAEHFEPKPLRKPPSGMAVFSAEVWWLYSPLRHQWEARLITEPEIFVRVLKALWKKGAVISALGITDAGRRDSLQPHTLANIETAAAEVLVKTLGKDEKNYDLRSW